MGNSGACACGNPPQSPLKQKLDKYADEGEQLPLSADGREGFRALELTDDQLGLASFILLRAFFTGCGGEDKELLSCLVCSLQDGYLANPYHNFAHAVDVLQTMVQLGKLMPWDGVLGPPVRFGLLVAALAHDVGHPGVGNVFLLDMGHRMAELSRGVSPLEHMHCSRLFELVREDRCAVFKHLPEKDRQEVRRAVTEAILHTDAARHSAVITELALLYAGEPALFDSGGDGLTPDAVEKLGSVDNKQLVARALLLGADLADQARPWPVAHAWAQRLREEMLAQGDQERYLGLPVPPLRDRHAQSFPEAQVGVLHAAAAPVLSAEVRLFRAWRAFAEAMASNAREWSSRREKELGAVRRQVEDPRVQWICTMLDDATRPSLTGYRESIAPVEREAKEPCSEPSCPEVGAAPMVREIRRWREVAASPGQTRELVMLYVVSDEGSGQPNCAGQPVLFRYLVEPPGQAPEVPTPKGLGPLPVDVSPGARDNRASYGFLEPDVKGQRGQAPVTSACSTPAVGSQWTEGPRRDWSDPITAQAWSDSACRQLEAGKFDTLLQSLLQDLPAVLHPRVERPPEQVVPERRPSSMKRRISGLLPTGLPARRPSATEGAPVAPPRPSVTSSLGSQTVFVSEVCERS